jgi:hypothetical protein
MGLEHALAAGTPDASGKRLGRWNDGAMTGSYLDCALPMPGLRALAGSTQGLKDYYIARAELIPPEELQKLIFPGLEQSILEWEQSSERDIAGKGALNFFSWLRVVILQDAAVLIRKV